MTDTDPIVQRGDLTFDTRARWSAEDDVCIDQDANATSAPSPTSKAPAEAIGWAVSSWITGAATLPGGTYALCQRWDRDRCSGWDHGVGIGIGIGIGRGRRRPEEP